MTIYSNALALIGNTPIVEVHHLDTGPCQLFLKLECQNPGGSIKDRIALNMIEQAEKNGDLQPGCTIVEATAGNTGLGLALIASLKGYRCVIVMPDKMSREKINHLKALGAEVIMTRSDVNKGHPEYYQDLAERITQETPNAYYINQFANPYNVQTHEQSTGPEIWQQMEKNLDVFVAGMGTSGTMTGVGRFLRQVNPAIELVLADPEGSILADYINKGEMGEAKSWLVEGIGEDFIPSISEPAIVNEAISVSDKEAFLASRALLSKEGIFGGSSTGTLLHAALRYCQAQTTPKRVLTLVCDTGNKYLSKLYNDVWMRDQGFFPSTNHGDLRDLIAYPQDTCVSISSHEPLLNAHNRMCNHQISQLPVLDEGQFIGTINEANLLAALQEDADAFSMPVSEAVNRDHRPLSTDASMEILMTRLQQDASVAIIHDNQFYGMISQIDVINHHRRGA